MCPRFRGCGNPSLALPGQSEPETTVTCLRTAELRRLPDREALQGILFVLHTGIAWTHLPRELGFGSGVTCWRRLDEWQRAGVWERLHGELLARLRAAGEIEWSRAVVDSSHVQAKKMA